VSGKAASDVDKVEGEDTDTPDYLRGDRVRLSAISDRECVSLGSLTMKPQKRIYRFPNICLIKQSNTQP